jgi:hypothetical protein
MRILLVATRPEDATAVESTLLDEGHTVTTCFDGHGGPCRGAKDVEQCPLESSVDLAVIARAPGVEPGLLEMGATCAVHHRVGVIEIDPADPPIDSLYDLADAAEAAVVADYERSVRDLVERALPPGAVAVIDVTRRDLDVHVSVLVDRRLDVLTVSAIADRARAGVRRHDRFAQVIDVAVVQGAC